MAKSLETPMKKVSKSLEQMNEQYKDLGKGFQFFGNAQSTQKKIDSLSNALETAKLKKEELEAAGKTEGTKYENAVKDVIKYTNQIESLQKKMSEPMTFEGDLSAMSEKELDEWFNNLPSIKAQAEQAAKSIKESFEKINEPLKEIDMTFANFSIKATEAFAAPQTESNRFSTNLNGLKEILYGIQERFLEFKGRLENLFVSKGLKTYTTEYIELQNQITKTEKTLATLNAQLARSRETVKGFEGTTSYRKMQYDIKQATAELQRLRNEQDKLETSGGATKWNFKGLSDGAKSLSKTLQSSYGTLKKVSDAASKFAKKILSIILPLKSLKKTTDGFHGSLSGGLKNILKYGIGIRSLYILFNKLRSAIKEGMENLVQYSSETNASVSLLANSINQLKNASAAMVSPLLNVLTPALDQIIQLCIKAANAVNQLIAALTGQSAWIRATRLTEDYAESISNAAKEAKNGIRSFDELNVITTQDTSGDETGTNVSDMFETVPIESKFQDIADKIKSVMKNIFEPLKMAWEKQGKFVMNSWKSAIKEIRTFAKDIGKDFLDVWQQGKTEKIFENILEIIGDIGRVAKNLAKNFRKAWKENKTGKKILENIRDIFAVITDNIKDASDYTVEWSENLNFGTLLEAFERFTSSLSPAIDALSGILTDFYTMVLLPLGEWTIEEGLPKLLDVFTEFNDKVDWENLRSSLSELWEHLEPFAETVGEGLILFIEDVSGLVADFVNSEEFSIVSRFFRKINSCRLAAGS